ncbi:MAG: glycerol-3-phosphate acyltransferase [Eggerthellaceae bacterium]|nr:glycerol-3-phosphate acyltransferase [Eggerthellaceae bacterium]
MQDALLIGGLFLVCFFLGSIPWGVIISRVFFHTDVREHGSGNIGTTNSIRAMGKVGGYAVFLLDFGKGLASGFIALAFSQVSPALVQVLLGVSFSGCVWGHIFSPWLKFKGGKGIAVAIGCLFVVFGPVGAVIELAIFGVLVVATRYVSVGSIAAAVACPFLALHFYWGSWLAWAAITIGALTVVWAHRGNIARLRAGTESRVGHKK